MDDTPLYDATLAALLQRARQQAGVSAAGVQGQVELAQRQAELAHRQAELAHRQAELAHHQTEMAVAHAADRVAVAEARTARAEAEARVRLALLADAHPSPEPPPATSEPLPTRTSDSRPPERQTDVTSEQESGEAEDGGPRQTPTVPGVADLVDRGGRTTRHLDVLFGGP